METNEKLCNNKKHINELMKKMHNGDTYAADELYEIMRIPLKAFIYRQVKDRNVTEDILQDVFVILLNKVKSMIWFINGFGYIYKITQREIYHYYKRLNRNTIITDEELERIPNKKDFEEELDFKILFNMLDEEEKEYISLKANGYKLEEIAEKKNVSLSTVKRKLNSIISKLKRSYDEEKYG